MDLKALHEVLRVMNRNIFLLFKLQMTKSITITSLALKILYTNFNNDKLLLPHILNKDIYQEIKKSYYGGRVEVYRPYGRKLYYYDVNSLYPFAAINKLPGLNASLVEYYDYNPDINKLFGFFYCKISTTNTINKYLGLLPHRDIKGRLTFPIGS